MKKKVTYGVIVFSLLLLFSCNKEENISSFPEREFIQMPVSIEIMSDKDILETRVEDEGMVAGTCNVNEILLLVYSGPAAVTDVTELTYESQQKLTCTQEGGKWLARGTITAKANTNYAVFALGYNKESDIAFFTSNPAPDKFEQGVTTYGTTKISLISTTAGTHESYKTPELFAGNVVPEGNTGIVFMATLDGDMALTGTLYRAVGKCSIQLTGIPSNIQKISWLTEKIADWNYLYREAYFNLSPKYPMGEPADGEFTDKISEVAYVERVGDTVWDAELESFFIPLKQSRFYIDATDRDGNKIRYLVKCADKMYNTIWIALIGYGVQDYYFYIKPNYQLSISGSFDQLKYSGSIKIDLSEMMEYDGGLLE